MDGAGEGLVGRTYTRGRRQPYLIRKWPGSNWALPMGPYTITQMLVFVGSVYLLLTYRGLWAHFGGFNLVIGVGIPVALTYATRHSRVEGRDPLRAGVALAGLLLRPRAGHLGGGPLRAPRPVLVRGGAFPVGGLPAARLPSPPPPPPPADAAGRWLAELVAELR
jgi:hypothetical protein